MGFANGLTRVNNGMIIGYILWLSGYVKIAIETMAIEIVSFSIKNGGSFNSYDNLQEGRLG